MNQKENPVTEKKQEFSWALYDWGNSAFSTTVLAAFFPVFFKEYWSVGQDASLTTFRLGISNSTAGLVVAILSLILGAVSDKGSKKKLFLGIFMTLGVVSTAMLYLVPKGVWFAATVFFVIASIGFAGGNIFYDSLLVHAAKKKRWPAVSALGYSLGYLGGGILFTCNILMTLFPQVFGLNDKASAVKASFLMVAIWWFIFSLPLFKNIHEPVVKRKTSLFKLVYTGWKEVKQTIAHVINLPQMLLFLFAFWIYIDGVNTIILMSVDYGASLGLNSSHLIAALLVTQFVAFPASLAYGKWGNKKGEKPGIIIGLLIYLFIVGWAWQMTKTWEFYLLAGLVGCTQGGVQSLSRSFFARMIPVGKSGEFFAFYSVVAKFAAILGPLVIAVSSRLTGSPRLSILAISLFFITGIVLLYRVDIQKAEIQAGQFSQKNHS